MFDRFSRAGMRVLVLSQDAARQLDHGFLGTEHVLLGLLYEDFGIVTEVMSGARVSYDQVFSSVRTRDAGRPSPAVGSPPFTPRAKRVVSQAVDQADLLKHPHVGPEHLLLAVLSLGEGVAVEVLTELGTDAEELRAQVEERIR